MKFIFNWFLFVVYLCSSVSYTFFACRQWTYVNVPPWNQIMEMNHILFLTGYLFYGQIKSRHSLLLLSLAVISLFNFFLMLSLVIFFCHHPPSSPDHKGSQYILPRLRIKVNVVSYYLAFKFLYRLDLILDLFRGI